MVAVNKGSGARGTVKAPTSCTEARGEFLCPVVPQCPHLYNGEMVGVCALGVG